MKKITVIYFFILSILCMNAFAIYDNFATNTSWNKTFSFTNSRFNVKDNIANISNPSGINYSFYGRNDTYFRNGILSVTIFNASGPYIMFRSNSTSRYEYNFLTNNLRCGVSLYGGFDDFTIKSSTIYNYTDPVSNDSILEIKFYENLVVASLFNLSNLRLISSNYFQSKSFYDSPNTLVALGTGANQQLYRDFYFANITSARNIVCLGDSNTAGTTLDFSDSYPSILTRLYMNDTTTIINSGAAGYTVGQLRDNIDGLLLNWSVNGTNVTNIVIVQGGINDFDDGKTPAQVFSNLTYIYETAKNRGWEVWALTNSPGNHQENSDKILELNNLIKSSSIPNHIIDSYSMMADSTNYSKPADGYIYNDGTHLRKNATALIAGMIFNMTFYISPISDNATQSDVARESAKATLNIAQKLSIFAGVICSMFLIVLIIGLVNGFQLNMNVALIIAGIFILILAGMILTIGAVIFDAFI